MSSSIRVDHTDRCVGCLLGGLVGDCLGDPVEGLSAGAIRQRFGRIQTLLPGPHMRDAAGDRQGMYTDDIEPDIEPGTPCSLAVIVSLPSA